MKIHYLAFMLAIAASAFAQEQPTFIRITPSALERITALHESWSKNRTKNVSLVLTSELIAPTSNSSGYSIKFEHLDIRRDETPPSGTIPIKIHGLEFRVTESLIARLESSTIDIVHVLSTDNTVNQIALVLRPLDPLIVDRYERKEVEQDGGANPAKPGGSP